MPAAINPVTPPTISSVARVNIDFDSEDTNAIVVVTFSDGSVQRFSLPADSSFLALAGAAGARKNRMYNVLLPLCGFTPGAIT